MSQVTVLLPVYNGMPYLADAVESVRRQTFKDWSLLAINDGSTDGSADYLSQLDDPRIRVVHQQNQGLAAALNAGLQICPSPYLARLDADDVALPTRLEKQLEFLEARPRVGLVGTQVAMMFNGRAGRGVPLPTVHSAIDAGLLAGRHAVCHSSIMCRTALSQKIGGYWPLGVSEDWDMYLRMAEQAELANLDEVLLHVRVVENGIQSRQMAEVRRRIDYACHAASRRRSGMPAIAYEEFCELRRAKSWWKRSVERLDTYARVQYRKAQPEILGAHPLVGYGRLAWAAACSPQLTWQRVGRALRRRLRASSAHSAARTLEDVSV